MKRKRRVYTRKISEDFLHIYYTHNAEWIVISGEEKEGQVLVTNREMTNVIFIFYFFFVNLKIVT